MALISQTEAVERVDMARQKGDIECGDLPMVEVPLSDKFIDKRQTGLVTIVCRDLSMNCKTRY